MPRQALLGLLGVALLGAPALAQTVDEVIAKNVEARGGLARLEAVQSVRMSGKMTMGPGMEFPMTVELKRPGRIRVEFTVQGSLGVQAYDGKAGWAISPMGSKQPEPMPAEAVKAMEEQADYDGPLVDYKAKGNQVELVGKEKVEGSDAYKLKVTLKGGDVRYLYLDADAYLLVKAESRRTIRGTEVVAEVTFGEYKEAGGVLWPHSIQVGAKDRPEKQSMTFDKVEVNLPIDDARFKMPEVKPAEPPRKD